METDILIIGGGLSGLALADRLHCAGRRFFLAEARGRLGGRILGAAFGGAVFDMGPAWFWHGQPLMATLVQRLGLGVFDQGSDGEHMYEDASGVQRGRGSVSMAGALRVRGGMTALVEGLGSTFPADRIGLDCVVSKVEPDRSCVRVFMPEDRELRAQRVVLALPPRLIMQIGFHPEIPIEVRKKSERIPTWMAGQAKALAVYEKPFWREQGLSGDAASRRGPMVEMHDASAGPEGPFAIFGFIGLPPEQRGGLKPRITEQLARLFGPRAADPLAVFIKDWARDPLTATLADHELLSTHPAYGPLERHGLDDRIILAGSEFAPQTGGYLEGALESAEAAFALC